MAIKEEPAKTVEWETPKELFEELDREFNFTLDPCCTLLNRKCRKYFTKDDDGLKQDWSNEIVFMNPPYGKVIGDWLRKAYESNATVVCLIPSRTDTKWWHDYAMKGEIRFIKGRVKFLGGIGRPKFPSAIVIFRQQGKICQFN